MLRLSNIKKAYKTGETQTEALKGISIEFRKAEFVSILGPSGCGKTTLLNIVGGLDRYNSGDLVIEGKSTKQYKDKDWDNYRNHSVGFVFQSYNLIPHQTVLENVELALTLSGVSKKERRERATEVLKKVGLKDKLKNKPNQLSGGQMQRVAIARALVNNPEIILADEPTGALDSKTSVQIMELLKEISNEKLIVMVTHNPELAEKYSTRIVKLKDGLIVDDSKPFTEEEKHQEEELRKQEKPAENAKNKSKMSFWTALSLSFKNLLTKKARTLLVSFAGSIGIIGIALVLAISSGFNAYVDKTQRNTLSSYPVEISNTDFNMASLMQIFMKANEKTRENDGDKVYVKQELTDLLSNFNQSNVSNDIGSFKEYVEDDGKTEIEKYTTAIQYLYGQGVHPYFKDSVGNRYINTNTTDLFKATLKNFRDNHAEINYDENSTDIKGIRWNLIDKLFSTGLYFDSGFWSEMIDNQKVLDEQYELIKGTYPQKANEVVIVLNSNNEISDYTLYGLGLLSQEKLDNLMDAYINQTEADPIDKTYTYDEIMSQTFKIMLTSQFYQKEDDMDPSSKYIDIRQIADETERMGRVQALYESQTDEDLQITISGIIRAKDDSNASINTCVAYTKNLTDLIIEKNNQNIQNILSGGPVILKLKDSKGNWKDVSDIFQTYVALNYIDKSNPIGVNLYPVNFDSKSGIVSFINKYNDLKKSLGEDEKVITYTDSVGTLMSSISMIISAITYILIAFVSVSLIVSSIMIGIITYISVIERTKEIGVLRSVGASKRDVKHVFTAESFIIGLTSGVFGIVISLILLIPINILLNHFTNLGSIAMLPVLGAVILVAISVILTFIAGLIPSRAAAKKDPVIALRAV